MKIYELFTKEALEEALDLHLVKREKHPDLDLFIYNYTANAQFGWIWNDVTLNCRGLIVDGEDNIVARPLQKFFTLEQLASESALKEFLDNLSTQEFEAQEKMDGSMLLVAVYKGRLIVSTRGSFISEQAIRGRSILENKYWDLSFIEGNTYIFEVIYPENRIVVDYKGMEDIVLLEVVENETGVEWGWSHVDMFNRPKIYSDIKTFEDLSKFDEPNSEGLVLKFKNGYRIKFKTDEYKRLHRLITGVSEKTVWEAMKDNKMNELLEGTPDEFYGFVKEVEEKLDKDFAVILVDAELYFKQLPYNEDRKTFALAADACVFRHKGILFRMYDNKPYSELIWKLIKPKVERVFKMVSEDAN